MFVRDILEEAPVDFPTIRTDALATKAAQVMVESDVRAVPVVEGDRLVGIVTDWDIVDAFAQSAGGLADMPVSAIMTSENLITIDGGATAVDAASLLGQHRVHHLPVLEEGRYRGVICLGLEWTEQNTLAPPVRPTLTARHP